MEKKFCIDCGKEIDYKSTRCLSCATSERNRGQTGALNHHWMGGKIERTCGICGAIFFVKPSRVRHGRGLYCSADCRRKAQSKAISGRNHPKWVEKVVKICEWCGKEIEVYPLDDEQGLGRFCSNECHGKWNSENLVGEKNSLWKGGPLVRKCENCGKDFETWASLIEQGKGRFCSRDCYGAYFSGERRPQWQGGISFEPYPPAFNEAFKRMIRDRDGHKCVLCGKTEEENGRKLAIHHVTYDKSNLDPGTKVSLCGSCHSRTNTHRSFWTIVFTKYWGRQLKQDWQTKVVIGG